MSFNAILRLIDRRTNETLLKPLCVKEIKVVVLQMHLDKALNLDGMNPTFFQKLWGTVYEDIVVS